MSVINEPTVYAALIASVPATIAAVAAYRSSRRGTAQLKTGNGATIGMLVQTTSDRIKDVSDRVDTNARDNTAAHIQIVDRLARMEARTFLFHPVEGEAAVAPDPEPLETP